MQVTSGPLSTRLLNLAAGASNIAIMGLRKEKITPKQIDREYPYQVELIVPLSFGPFLDLLHVFPRNHGMLFETQGGSDRRSESVFHTMRWCFTTREHAEAFQKQFGGEIIVVEQEW